MTSETIDIEVTLAKRQVYGDFEEVGHVAQGMKTILRNSLNRHALSRAEQEALDMICTKMARIVCGDPGQKDSWHDISGYARLAEKEVDNRVACGGEQ